jgi:hypothetical protein
VGASREFNDLVERFDEQIEIHCSPEFNETQLRREFVDPFFRALGWDIDNRQGHAQAYKEVIRVDSINIGRSTKAPDYSFRVTACKISSEEERTIVRIRQMDDGQR